MINLKLYSKYEYITSKSIYYISNLDVKLLFSTTSSVEFSHADKPSYKLYFNYNQINNGYYLTYLRKITANKPNYLL